MTARYHLFEVCWDAAAAAPGALPPPFDRARATAERFADRWVVLAPRAAARDGSSGLPRSSREPGHEAFEEACGDAGVPVEVVRWEAPSRPLGILVDAVPRDGRRDAVLSRLWRAHRIDSLFGGAAFVDALLFGHAAGVVLARWWAEAAAAHPGAAVAVAHGPLAGTSLLALRDAAPEVGTVYLVEEPVLGRAVPADPVAVREESPEPALEAARAEPIGLQSEHTVELACSAAADVLAASGPRAAEGVARWLGREADAVVPVGVDAGGAAVPEARRSASRAALDRAVAAVFGRAIPRAAHVAVSVDGRGDGGLALALDALAVLDRRPGRTVVAWVYAPTACGALRRDVAERLASAAAEAPAAGDTEPAGDRVEAPWPPAGTPVSTHDLADAAGDPVERRVRELGLEPGRARRVLVVRLPVPLGEADGLLRAPREETIAGHDVALHLAASATGDRAALASLAAGTPVVVTEASALARAVGADDGPVSVAETGGAAREEAMLDVATAVGAAIAPSRDRARAASAARGAAAAWDWPRSLPRHEDAWREALARAAERREEAATPREVTLPPSLEALARLGRGFRWTWDAEAGALFEEASPAAWRASRHTPSRLVRALASRRGGAWERPEFRARVDAALARRDEASRARARGGDARGGPIAYFCAEFGLHESLPVYGGGLGILAGDHLKAASDLGLPLVGVGLLYRRGRTRQRIGRHGDQRLLAAWSDPRDLALEEVRDEAGRPLEVEVPLSGGSVLLRAWRAGVDRVPLYLLDADVSDNAPDDRTITHVLYPSDAEARLAQELVLGRGGMRLLRRLGLVPRAIHLNEGHPAFAAVERVADLVRDGSTFEHAVAAVRAATVFTTHTPVPAGHDRFDESLVLAAAGDLPRALGVDDGRFLALARDGGRFNLTRLAISLASRVNGVSALHGRVSRRLLAAAWLGVPEQEVPVGHVTNGVHLASWTHPSIAGVLGAAGRPIRGEDFASGARTVDLEALWAARQPLRRRLLERTRAGLERRFAERRLAPADYDRLRAGLDDRALLVGFARRFAGYKRATLLLSDVERLARILSSEERPVRLLVAGKAHPSDREGKAALRAVAQAAREGPLAGRLFLLEDYGLALARTLVQGSDVWLNLPRRGLEASGTSGMKAAANGALNLSVPDGWWAEAADGENGWSIGGPAALEGGAGEDAADAASLYARLEEDVVPLFFQRDAKGVPWKWLSCVQHSLATIPARFDAERMVREYAATCYGDVPASGP